MSRLAWLPGSAPRVSSVQQVLCQRHKRGSRICFRHSSRITVCSLVKSSAWRVCDLAKVSNNTQADQMRRRSLCEWETEFCRGLNQVDLLGELCPTEQDVLELGRQIGSLVKQRPNWHSAAQSLRDEFPLCYTVFLVGVGMYCYADGDFWSDIRKITGIPSLLPQRWGGTV